MKTRRSWKNQDRLFKQLGNEKAPVVHCEWKEDDLDCGCWHTGCGEYWALNGGTLKENKMNFCFNCGKPIKEITYQETDATT